MKKPDEHQVRRAFYLLFCEKGSNRPAGNQRFKYEVIRIFGSTKSCCYHIITTTFLIKRGYSCFESAKMSSLLKNCSNLISDVSRLVLASGRQPYQDGFETAPLTVRGLSKNIMRPPMMPAFDTTRSSHSSTGMIAPMVAKCFSMVRNRGWRVL